MICSCDIHCLRNLHSVLPSGFTNLHSHQQCRRLPFSPQPPQHVLFVDFYMMALLMSVMWYFFTRVLVSISLIISDIEHVSCAFWPPLFFLDKYLCGSSAHFSSFNICIVMLILFVHFGDWPLVCLIVCECFLPLSRLSFHFVYGFSCRAKAFKFNSTCFNFVLFPLL